MANITRRDLLRGLGTGAVLLSPFVRQVTAAAAGKPSPNFMVFYTPNGHVRSAFGSSGSGAAFTLKPSLAALEPYKAKVTMLQGIDNPGASAKAGGAALGMAQAQTLGGGSPSNVWVSVGKAMGLARDSFGSGSSGGLPGLFKG